MQVPSSFSTKRCGCVFFHRSFDRSRNLLQISTVVWKLLRPMMPRSLRNPAGQTFSTIAAQPARPGRLSEAGRDFAKALRIQPDFRKLGRIAAIFFSNFNSQKPHLRLREGHDAAASVSRSPVRSRRCAQIFGPVRKALKVSTRPWRVTRPRHTPIIIRRRSCFYAEISSKASSLRIPLVFC